MISARHGRLLFLAASLTAAAAASASCNAVLGIRDGKPGGGGGSGGTGGGVCPPEKPATCEEPYLSDAESCCALGRSCQGGDCVAGVCLSAPHSQSADGNEAIGIVRVGDLVLWAGGYERAIYQTDVDGAGLAPLVGPAQHDFGYITMLAADPDPDGYVFFTDYEGSRIGRATIDGGQAVVLAQVPESVVPGARARWGRILVHGDHVYWSLDFQAQDEMGNQAGKNIWRAPREPAGQLPVDAEIVVATDGAFGIAADDYHLYFGNTNLVTGGHTIERLAWSEIGKKDDSGAPVPGVPEVLAQGSGWAGDVAVDDTRVYWAIENEVRHQKKDLPNSTVTTVSGMNSYVWGIVSDGRDIYVSTVGDGSSVQGGLWRAPAGGVADAQLLYETQAEPIAAWNSVYSMAQDCDTVYFVVQIGGFIRRVTK